MSKTSTQSFLNFQYFIGTVEDRNDPMKLGRVRVRALGVHSEDKSVLPTEDLPWAQTLYPVSSASMHGIGEGPTGLVEGTWVCGFFIDGDQVQQPIILGTLSGKQTEKRSAKKGFSDPNGVYPKTEFLNESDVNRLARNENIDKTIVQIKKDSLDTGIQTASGETWDEPETPYAAEYPFNHVSESESGHIFEVDDTKGAERLHKYHRTGTFEEVHPDGTRVTKIVLDNYSIIAGSDFCHVKGSCNITVDNNATLYIKGNLVEKIDGNYTIEVSGSKNETVVGSINTTAAAHNVEGNINHEGNISTNGNVNAEGDVKAGSISLKEHRHVITGGSSAGTTSPSI